MNVESLLKPLHLPQTSPAATWLTQTLNACLQQQTVQIHCGQLPQPQHILRWLHRAAIEQHARWFPMMMVRGAHPTDQNPWWRCAFGGWLVVDTPPAPNLKEAAIRGELTLIELTDQPSSVNFEPQTMAAFGYLDQFYGVATDPDLDPIRRVLSAHCATSLPVCLLGEDGVGKRALAQWIHANTATTPLNHIHSPQDTYIAGRWSLFANVECLPDEQHHSLNQALNQHKVHIKPSWPAPSSKPRPTHRAFDPIIGNNAQLVDLLWSLDAVATSTLSVMILGEAGVGKELIARAVHDASGRTGPFVALDMGALPDTLAESALFGHKKGAFTGAVKDRIGALRKAHQGTLFLDEIGNVSPTIQAKLLRALQEGCVRPLGSDQTIDVDVRIISATNQNIQEMSRRGEFRLDLLTRLNAVLAHVPPLRERTDDIETLAAHILSAQGAHTLSERAIQCLLSYSWPGNIREMINVLRYASALAEDQRIEPQHLQSIQTDQPQPVIVTCFDADSLEQLVHIQPHAKRRLTTVCMDIPPVRHRSMDAKKQIILAHLDGRPIQPSALHLLAEHAWWGNLPEMSMTLRALCANSTGILRVEHICDHLPQVVNALDHAPIHVLQHPTMDRTGNIDGLSWDFDAATLVIGRIPHRQLLDSQDQRMSQWRRYMDTHSTGEPGFLSFDLLRRLSRVHALVTRNPNGLLVHRMPNSGLALYAGPLDGPLEAVEITRPVECGQALELRIVLPDERPYLQLFVFNGPLARVRWLNATLQRAEDVRAGVLKTQYNTMMTQNDQAKTRVWTLNEAETQILIDIICSYAGGGFKNHIIEALQGLEQNPQFHALVSYFEHAPRATQYMVRLCEKTENKPLRLGIQQRYAQMPHPERFLHTLPTGLRRLLST